ncbi:hypothetical protein C8R46DRAFT_1214908 [Mycena filopes]|nr:hypothetical protein C8R46DRAFT_1214908 [Mycena filopes]
MDALVARFETERTAGTITSARLLEYMATVLRTRHLLPLDTHMPLDIHVSTIPVPSPGFRSALIVAEADLEWLQRNLEGSQMPLAHVVLQIDGVSLARCLLNLPRLGAATLVNQLPIRPPPAEFHDVL